MFMKIYYVLAGSIELNIVPALSTILQQVVTVNKDIYTHCNQGLHS